MSQTQPFQFEPKYATDEEGEESLSSSQSNSEDDEKASRIPSQECDLTMISQEFHILFVKQQPQNEDIFVELLPRSLSSESLVSKTVLIFKSASPVKWRVASQALHGVLEIQSDSTIEVENLSSNLTIEAKEKIFSSDFQTLIRNIQDYDEASLITYSQVDSANKIKFIIDAIRESNKGVKQPARSLARALHHSNIQKRERSPFFQLVESSKKLETSTSSQIPSSIGQNYDRRVSKEHFKEQIHRLRVVDEYRNSFGSIVMKPGQISALEIAVMRAMKIECLQRIIILSLDKNLIESLLTESLEISFADPKCQANVKFAIKSVTMDHIKLPEPMNFQCKYQLDHENDENSEKVKFSIKLYKDMNYKQEITDVGIPLDIDENKTIYVHVFANIQARDLGVLIDKCWISTSNHEKFDNISSDLLLIKDSCPVDKNSEFLQEGSNKQKPSQKFLFKVHKRFSQSFLFVHCNFSLCHKQKHRRIIQCLNIGELCKSKRVNLSQKKAVRLIHKAAGPLRILGKKEIRKDPDDKKWIDEIFRMSEINDKSEQKLIRNDKKEPSEPQQIVLLGLATEAIAGIGFASFIIGAIFMGVLWCIYVRTEPRRQRRNNNGGVNVQMQSSGYNLCPQTTIHSGSSTPNSQTPMSA
ncbi:Transforming growth factor beta receptor type 3 [Nymphon striatum]|nr:Transforming growth factor beta receptor type 3 [Nymphon striatum]